jgi:hypothetical protein
MKAWAVVLSALVLSACAYAPGPTTGRSLQLSGPLGEMVSISETRQRPQPLDVFLECRSRNASADCEAEARRAMMFSCTPDTMQPVSLAFCLRCLAKAQPDDEECKRLAATIASTSGSSTITIDTPYRPDGTADPIGHPRIGPPPPLR